MSKSELSLRDSAKQAMIWSAGFNLIRDVLQFGQMLILARILDPAIYGTAGLASTLINFIGLAAFQHVIPHVLQIRSDKQVNYHLHFTAGLILNCALFVLTNFIAYCLRFTEDYGNLQPLLHILSLTFLLSVPVDMRVKMLERDHDWHRLRSLQLVGLVIIIAGGIVMGVSGAGVYALIVPGLVGSSVFAIDLFLFAGWRPQWQWNYSNYRETLRFGLNRAGSNVFTSGRTLLQNTLISQHAQFSGLGLFARAEGLANMFCGRVAQQITGGLYPIITRAEVRSTQFQRISDLVLSSVVWVVMPISVFLSLESFSLVKTLYGAKWVDVAPLLPLAMASGLAICVGATAYSLLLANDQSRLCLRTDMIAFVIGVAPIIMLIPLGIKIYLAGALIANFIIAVILLTLLIKTNGLQPKALIRALAPPTVAAVSATLGSWIFRAGPATQLPDIVALLISWLVFTAVYLVALRVFFRAALAEIVTYIPAGKKIGRMLWL